jgi:hypothetical protein
VPTHYEVLGVAPTATAEEIREAYRARARLYHPDRHVDGSPAEQSAAAVRMREVNEAWRVLSDSGRRAQHDATQRRSPTARPATPSQHDDLDDVDDVELSPGAFFALRAVPWLLVLGVFAVIFIFTAYATSGDGGGPPPTTGAGAERVGTCVEVAPGPVTSVVPCERPNDGQVVAEVDADEPCPSDLDRLDLVVERDVCLDSSRASAGGGG